VRRHRGRRGGAVAEVGLRVPLVVRLAGTNVEQGTKMLAESGLPITTASDMATVRARWWLWSKDG